MEQQYNLAQQLKNIWRHLWIIIVLCLVAGGTALILTSVNPPLQKAQTTVMVGNTEQSLSAVPSELQGVLGLSYLQDIESQIEMMKSRNVLEQAIIKLEPEKSANPDYLQAEVNQLQSAIDIEQMGNTNTVTLAVTSTDPLVAQQQANAVAEAYNNEVRQVIQTAIQSALVDINQRLGELQKNSVDISTNPSVSGLTAQIDITLSALEAASSGLQSIGGNATELAPVDAGTVLTTSQVSIMRSWTGNLTSESSDINNLIKSLKPVSSGGSYSERSSAIAVIEGRIRTLITKLDSLIAYITDLQKAETDPLVNQELVTTGEQLQEAAASGGVILEQIGSLYDIQAGYVSAVGSEASSTAAIVAEQEADVSALQRIVENNSLLIDNLNTATIEIGNISPRSSTITQWRLNALNDRITQVTATLHGVEAQLKQTSLTPGQDVFLTQEQLLVMEINARVAEKSLSSFLSELDEIRSNGLDVQTSTNLLGVRESLNVANNAFGGLGDAIAAISQSGGDTASYNTLETLRQQLQIALLSSNFSGNGIVDRAVVSPTGGGFTQGKSVILAIIAGLLLSILGILIFQYYDRIVRNASQVTNQTGLPLLASITAGEKGGWFGPSALDGRTPQYLESFRLLRTNLGLDSVHGKVLLVTSPMAGEGKTIVAANLARTVAMQGRNVLLIDGNLRHPEIADLFGLIKKEGLAGILTRGEEEKSYVAKAEGVDVLPAGLISAQSVELFSLPRFKTLLAKYRQNYDVIIIDSAPVKGWTDTKILAKEADSVLLVLKPDASRIDLVRESKQALESVGAHVEGFVLYGVKPKESVESVVA
jgi:capsular exopolysaccharide synthesis family protein